MIDLKGTDIGTSIKISSVKLWMKMLSPTITDRDFVIATVPHQLLLKNLRNLLKKLLKELKEEMRQQKVQKQHLKDGEAGKKDEKGKEAADKKAEDKKPAEKNLLKKKKPTEKNN